MREVIGMATHDMLIEAHNSAYTSVIMKISTIQNELKRFR